MQTSVGELDHWIRLWSFQLKNIEYEAELARMQQTTYEWKRLRSYNDPNVSHAVHIPQGGALLPKRQLHAGDNVFYEFGQHHG